MGTVPKIHEYLLQLDFINAKSGRDYIGTKDVNPVIYLEDNVPVWNKMSTLAEISAALSILKERVCVSDFPARYSPPFWLAQAALQALYKILSSYLLAHFSEEVLQEVSYMLFDFWVHLISAGPGSSHLEMMDIILKNQHFPLWKYMETLKGEELNQLITTLKCDFVYEEEVSSDHYATLMETHIDKIFRTILKPEQFLEAQRGFLDLHLYYLGRMNHVPPHIGPRLSHLCFLICQKYELENPYIGLDDWVLMRHHLKTIKDVVTDWTFTVASEAQYRAPITLEKIFQATIVDNMLELMFKEFMSLLLVICGHNNSKKCKRLFAAYQTALFQQIDVNNVQIQSAWLFDQCMTTLAQVASTNGIETHIEHMVISAVRDCLLNTNQFQKKEKWEKLLENYVVSGRHLLVQEASYLLQSEVLLEAGVFNWKESQSQARMLIDIISDLPKSFLQDDSESAITNTVDTYVQFLMTFITHLRNADVIPKVQDNLHKCIIKCLAKDPLSKARLATVCIQEQGVNFQTEESKIHNSSRLDKDLNFLRELLFCIEKLLKDDDCLTVDEMVSSTVESLLASCLNTFREKGYIPVDFKSLMMSISLTCISGDGFIQTDTTGPPYDIYHVLYNSIVLQFIRMHQTHGTLRLVSNIVPNVIQLIHEGIEQGTSIARCVSFLHWLGTSCPEIITNHCTEVLELFLDWECYIDFFPLVPILYSLDSLSVIRKVPVMFEKLKSADQTDRQTVLTVLRLVAENHAEVFSADHISQLVSMYRHETTSSQQMILQIIHRVALSSPAVVFGFYAQLTDDTKFPVTSLRDRAPILTALCQYSEDVAKKTTDYLMTHISNKDSTISLVAMETVEPLLKTSPVCLMKHKQKLRTVGKTSSSVRVKEICKALIPDTQVKGPKIVETTAGKVTEIHKNSFSKTKVDQTKMSKMTKSKKLVTAKEPTSESVSESDMNMKKPVSTVDLEICKSLDHNMTIGRSEAIYNDQFNVRTSNDESLKIQDISEGSFGFPHTEFGSDALTKSLTAEDQTKVAVNSCQSNEDNGTVVDLCKTNSHILTIIPPISNEIQKYQKDTVKVTEELCEKCTEPLNENVKPSDTERGLQSTRIFIDKKQITAVNNTDSVMTNGLSGAMPESPAIYLSFHPSCHEQVIMLRHHLKMAGYECWVDTGQTGSGDREVPTGIQEAKVVICCLTDKFLNTSECCKEVSAAVNMSKPIIPLTFTPVSFIPTSLLHDILAIRFYTKPAEVKVTMGFWVEHKFQELLMQLNYLRIFPNEKIVTKVYENWWLPKQLPDQEDPSDGGENVGLTLAPAIPNVFISYNWGKQNEVKCLYQQLTDLGYSCWLGVYQMSGSESLYNKITQGLQGCRVMLACITKKYTRAVNCQQEVRLAHSLKRPIIPLLLEEVRWPPQDEIGRILANYKYITVKHLNNAHLQKVVEMLKIHVPNVKEKETNSVEKNIETKILDDGKDKVLLVDKVLTETSETLMEKNNATTAKIKQRSGEPIKQVDSERKTMQKSSSMFEIEKASDVRIANINKTFTSKTDDDIIVKKNIPEGVIVDEMGYTVKSSRSKSCVIL